MSTGKWIALTRTVEFLSFCVIALLIAFTRRWRDYTYFVFYKNTKIVSTNIILLFLIVVIAIAEFAVLPNLRRTIERRKRIASSITPPPIYMFPSHVSIRPGGAAVGVLPLESNDHWDECHESYAVAPLVASVSTATATVCGADTATADRYEERNNALRSIMRERHLPTNDVATLTAWLASTNDALRVERLAALKNDVMNLLRAQEPTPTCLADTLVSMFESEAHPPAVLDYSIQHLGAVQGDIADESMRRRIRATLVKAANRTKLPYAGTALYALAEDLSATSEQDAELRRLTLALCSPDANAVACIAAVQLAGQRGYAEALPILREALSSAHRDAVTDIVCLGSLGLLGTADDIPLLQRFATMGPRYAPAAETAINRIEERRSGDGKQRSKATAE